MEENFKKTIQSVANYLWSNYKVSKSGKSLAFNGKAYQYPRKLFLDDDDLLIELDVFNVVKRSSFDINAFEANLIQDLTDRVDSKISGIRESIFNEDYKAEEEKDGIQASQFLPVLDLEAFKGKKTDSLFFFNKRTRNIAHNLSPIAYGHLIGEELYKQISSQFPLGVKRYDPYKVNNVKDDRVWIDSVDNVSDKIKHFNTCLHPNWRYKRNKDAKLSDEIIYFIESSFKTPLDLQYYIDSAYTSVVDKVWCYVVVHGIKGTGKTKLIEMLQPLVGKDNWDKAPANVTSNRFNGYKKDKRVILMDETEAKDTNQINILKSDANKDIVVEEKHVNAKRYENFSTVFMCSNNISDFKFSFDERRFSVVETTDKPIWHEDRDISFDWMHNFSQMIEDIGSEDNDYFCNAFFNYLESKRSLGFNNHQPYKSPLFYRIVEESLTGWEKRILDAIVYAKDTPSQLYLMDIFDENEKLVPKRAKRIEDFLSNFECRGRKLGTYSRSSRIMKSFIDVDSIFVNEETKTFRPPTKDDLDV